MGPRLALADAPPAVGGLINPGGIAYSAELRRIYAVDRVGGRLLILGDSLGSPKSVRVGAGPVSVAVDGRAGTAYVADADDGTLAVLDALSGAVRATLPIGGRPYSVAVDPERGRVFVTDASGDGITMVDTKTLGVSRLKTGSADLVAVDPGRGTVELIGYGTALRILGSPPAAVREVPVGKHAWGLALNPSSGAAYVCLTEDSQIVEIDPDSGATALLPAGDIPCAVAVDSGSAVLVVANYRGNSATVLDAARRRVLATVPVGKHPGAVAIDPIRHLVFVANGSDASITAIDEATHRVLGTLPGGRNPYALAVVAGSDRLYVANNDPESPLTVVDLRSIGAGSR